MKYKREECYYCGEIYPTDYLIPIAITKVLRQWKDTMSADIKKYTCPDCILGLTFEEEGS